MNAKTEINHSTYAAAMLTKLESKHDLQAPPPKFSVPFWAWFSLMR